MHSSNRRTFLKASAAISSVGLTSVAGCLGDDTDIPTLGLNYVVPFENYPYFFDVEELRGQVSNLGEMYEINVTQDESTVTSLNTMAAGETEMVLTTTESFANSILEDVVPGGFTGILVDFWDAHPDFFGFEIYSPPDSDITEPADLEGASLGLNAVGTGVHAVYIRMLQDLGLDPDEDVTFVEQPFPTMVPGLEEGSFDVAIFVAQFATQPRAEGYNLVFSTQDLYNEEVPFGYIVVDNETLEEHEDAVSAFAEDYVEMSQYCFENRDEVIEISADHFDVPEEYLDAFLFTENDWYRQEFEFDFDRLQLAMDELVDVGIAAEHFDTTEYATNEYLP